MKIFDLVLSRRLPVCAVAFTMLFPVWLAPASAPDASTILKRVDRLRNPINEFSVDLELTSVRKEKNEVWKLKVFGQDSEKSLVEFVSPPSEKGKYLLMRREAMWFYIPDTSRPIRISPLQRLMGEASNGDVARTSYSEDYTVEQTKEEDLDGVAAIFLDLTAKDKENSYSRVCLWVSKDKQLPLRADYYASSGKMLKRLFFREYGQTGGGQMVTGIEIHDAVRPDRRTFMRYSNLQAKTLPEKMFNQSFLGRW